ncbi:SH3 domain-binding protein 1 [Scomber scombrus]|uniref:SH3 domain-binding protein 1 n=1 Tax=Scomber scombrus TaxID=13677 RepID=UPI002DDB67EF|nr:SH3 domain-binding protein 1 [Scomber scombrus]
MLRQSLSILKQFGSTARTQDATELLHEDLVMVEQRVEPAKKAAQVLYKKLHCCMQSQTGLETEKRMKKLPLMLLSISMAESLKDFDAESSIRKVLEMCCFMEKMLANLLAEFEMKVEKEVLEPLSKLSEDDLPEILKNKKQFSKLTTDWNNAKTRSQASTGPQAKQDGLREEVEEAWRKLESIKDQYSADLYCFATKEDDYANYFIRLLELQAEYHKSSHEFLEKNICELKENHTQKGPQPSLSNQKVYGEPLLAHLSLSSREIAAPIQECIHMLLTTGMREEVRLTVVISTLLQHPDVFYMSPECVTGALKCYLRELPEPLMTFDLYSDWFKAAGEKDMTEKMDQFKVLLKKLPPENYNNLRYLVQFLSLLSEQQAVNKMTPSNIAIVLGPNLLWPKAEGEIALYDMASASSVQVVTVIEPLIQYSSKLFPEAVSFEIPELPELPDATLSAPVAQCVMSQKDKLSRSMSSSSTTSSCSSYHLPLSKTNSETSQDSGAFFLVKSGSVSRGGTTTWASPATETPSPIQQSTTPGSSATLDPILALTANLNPSPPPRAVGSTSSSGPTQKQCSDLEPIMEAPPDSPRALLKMSVPYKPKRSYNVTKDNDQPTVQFTKPKPQLAPKLQAPPAPPPTAAAAADTKTQPTPAPRACPKKPPPKKPGLKAPNCPPPLPPPSQEKQVPSIAQ